MADTKFDDVIITNFDHSIERPFRSNGSSKTKRNMRSQSCHAQPTTTFYHRPQMRPFNGEISIIDLTSDADPPYQEVTIIRPEYRPASTPELGKKSLSKYLRLHRTSVASCPANESQYNGRPARNLLDQQCYSSGDERSPARRTLDLTLHGSQARRSIRDKKGSLDSHGSQESLDSLNSRNSRQSKPETKRAHSETCLYSSDNVDSTNFAHRLKKHPYVEVLSEEGTVQTYNLSHHRTSVTNTEAYDFVCKVVLLGDSGVGKTCVLMKYKENTFLSGAFISTVGIDFRNKIVSVDGAKVKLQIWDTAGQERFRSVTHAYYRDAHALLLLYDVSSKVSFDNTRAWLAEVHEYAQDDVVIMLIGNKCDIPASERQIRKEDGERLAREYNVAFTETSAKTGLNVDLAFTAIARDLKSRKSENMRDKQFNVADYVRQEATPECICSVG